MSHSVCSGHDAEFQRDVRTPPMQPHVYEGKYELDSLASVLRLVSFAHSLLFSFRVLSSLLTLGLQSNKFAAAGGKMECFDPVWAHSIKLIMDVIEVTLCELYFCFSFAEMYHRVRKLAAAANERH